MIDPTKVTDFERSRQALEEFLLFSICVAGKNADQQAWKLECFLEPGWKRGIDPSLYIEDLDKLGMLESRLKAVKLGKYQLLAPAFRAVAALQRKSEGSAIHDLDRVRLIELPGVSMKTASFWLLHSFPHQRVAVLDTYALKHLQEQFPKVKVPTTSPQNPAQYMYWETLWIGAVRSVAAYDKLSLAEIDLMLWNHYSLKYRRDNNGHQILDPARRGSDIVVAG